MRRFLGLLLIALASGKRKRGKKNQQRTTTMECTETMNCDDGSFCAINQGESGSCSVCPPEEFACFERQFETDSMPSERAIAECKQFCFGDFSNDDDSGSIFDSEKVTTCATNPDFAANCDANCQDTDTCTCIDTPSGPYCRQCKHNEIGYGDTKLCYNNQGGIHEKKCWSGPEGGCQVPCREFPERYGDCKCVTTDIYWNTPPPSRFGQQGKPHCVYCPAGKKFVTNWGECTDNNNACPISNIEQCAKSCINQGLPRYNFEEPEKEWECGKCHCCQEGQFFKEDGTCYWPSFCNLDTEQSCKEECDHTQHGDCQCFHQAAGDICEKCPLKHEFDLHPDVQKCVPTTGCMSHKEYKDTIENVYCPAGNGYPPKNGWTCGFYSNAECSNGESIGIKCKAPAYAANDHIKGAHCKMPGAQWSDAQWSAPQCPTETAQTCAAECTGDASSRCICEAQFETGQREDVCVDTCEEGKFFRDGKCVEDGQCGTDEWNSACPNNCLGTSKHSCKCFDDVGPAVCSECENGEWRYGNTELCVSNQVVEGVCSESSKAGCNEHCGDKDTFGDCKCITMVDHSSGKPVKTDKCVYCPKDLTFGNNPHSSHCHKSQDPANQCADGRYMNEGDCHSDCLSGMWSWTAPSAENKWCGGCTCCPLGQVIDGSGKCFKPDECTLRDRASCEATCWWQPGKYGSCTCVADSENEDNPICIKCQIGEYFDSATRRCKLNEEECTSSANCVEHCRYWGPDYNCQFFDQGPEAAKCDKETEFKGRCRVCRKPKIIKWYGGSQIPFCGEPQGNSATGLFCSDESMDKCAKECRTGEFEGCHCVSTGNEYGQYDICKKCPKGEMFHPYTEECVKRVECFSSEDCGGGSICNFDFGYGGFCEKCSDVGHRKSDCDNFIDPKGAAECEKTCVIETPKECKESENVKNKPGFCTDVTTYYTKTNSWVCKNCFNVRIEFNLGWIGAVGHWWDNKDYIWLAFKEPVSVIKAQGPVESVEPVPDTDAQGYYRFKVSFNANAQFGDRRIDVNIEFNDLDMSGELAWARACPCGIGGSEDICDPAGITTTAPGGYWKCSWNRKSNVQNRMNKCEWMCYGDEPYGVDYSTGAKTRCFREQGKKFKDNKELRELGKWIMGRNSADRVKCTKKKN